MAQLKPLFAALAGAAVLLAASCGTPAAPACPDTPGAVCIWAGTNVGGFNGDGLDRRETRLHWPIADPDRKHEQLSEDERLSNFCVARDEIRRRLRELVTAL